MKNEESLIKVQLREKLDEIYSNLNFENIENTNIGVLNGISGVSLFYFYYSKLNQNDKSYNIGIKLISQCFEKINSGYELLTYCSGIAGFGWVLEHLLEEDFIDFENDKTLKHLDNLLESQLKNDLKNQNYDYLHGAIGYVYFFLKRYNNTKSKILSDKYKKIILTFINSIKETAIIGEDGAKWKSDFSTKTTQQVYNFSLSHGIPSITNFLTRLYLIEEFKVEVEEILKLSIKYLLSKEKKQLNSISLFPDFITIENTTPTNHSRLAWCYGDLGIGITLLNAAITLNDNKLKEDSIRILLHTTNRKSMESTMLKDAGVCHGIFGVAIIYKKAFNLTGNETFRETYLYWCKEGLKMASHDDGQAGYKKWVGGSGVWQNEISLLEGVSGIGLSIIDILENSSLKWNESLMISL